MRWLIKQKSYLVHRPGWMVSDTTMDFKKYLLCGVCILGADQINAGLKKTAVFTWCKGNRSIPSRNLLASVLSSDKHACKFPARKTRDVARNVIRSGKQTWWLRSIKNIGSLLLFSNKSSFRILTIAIEKLMSRYRIKNCKRRDLTEKLKIREIL